MLLIDKYAYFNRLKDVHPLEKMTFSMMMLIFSLMVQNIVVSLITFIVMSSFILFAAKIPFSYYVKLLLLPAFFLLSGLITILLSFDTIDTLPLSIAWSLKVGNWFIFITHDSIVKAIKLFFTVLGSISCLYFLTLTTPMTTIFDILRKWKIPKLLIELIELTYRFIFVFLETSHDIFLAQHSRLGYISIRQGIKSLGLLVSSLFIQVFQRSHQLTNAMNARCYKDDLLFIQENYRYSMLNWIIMILFLIALMIIDIQFGGTILRG